MAGFSLMMGGMMFWGGAGPALAKTVEEIAVVVDQDSMTRGELEESVQAYFMSQGMKEPLPGTPAYETARKSLVDSFVQEVLLAEEADREKIEVSDAELDREVNNQIDNMKKGFATEQEFNDELKKEGISIDDLKQDAHDKLLRRLKANRALRVKQQEAPGTTVVTDEAAKQYFHDHPQDYEQVKFSIILFRIPPKAKPGYAQEVEKQARGLLKELKGGADFAAYAKKYSEDQGTAEKGGAVGTVYRAELEPKLANGIFAIPEKGMGVVRAEDGLYIVKVDFKGQADFPSVAPGIKDHLQKEQKDSGLKDWLADLRKGAYILVDGKILTTASTAGTTGGVTMKPAPTGTSPDKTQDAPGAAQTPAAAEETSQPAPQKSDLYPSLSPGGGWTLALGAEGFSYGSQDLADIHGPGADTKQGFPFGFGLSAGLYFAIDPTFQIGFLAEGLQKTQETVTDQAGNSFKWGASAFAPSLALKIIIPMDESTNFILSGAGGYYFLLGGSVNVVNGTNSETADLSASNWGGKAGGSLEFMLDSAKNTSLEFGVDYRLLRFTPVTAKVTAASTVLPAIASPLLNNDGVNRAAIDFSGVNVGLGIRFYLDKND
jgi:parvulin-like peptidyl-prolyl isomerase